MTFHNIWIDIIRTIHYFGNFICAQFALRQHKKTKNERSKICLKLSKCRQFVIIKASKLLLRNYLNAEQIINIVA